jgi:hypothetical protein
MADVSYVPGGLTAIVTDACCVLIRASPEAPVVAELWHRFATGPQLDAIITGLLKFGFAQLPDFVLLTMTGDRCHVLSRGDASASLVTPDGDTVQVSGAGLATWLDQSVPPGVCTVVLGDVPAQTGHRLPVAAGIFLASAVIVGLADSAGASAAQHAVPGEPAPPPLAPPPAAPEPQVLEPPLERLAGPGPQPGDQVQIETIPWRPTGPAQLVPDPSPEPVEYRDPTLANGMIEAVPLPAAWLPTRLSGQDGDASANAVGAVPWPPPGGGVLPSWVHVGDTWGSEPDDRGDEMTAATLRRSDLPKAVPTVHAVLCTRSHASPPNTLGCRVCGEPLPLQDPVVVPRPMLGVLRLSTGGVVTLERGAVLGRNPSAQSDGGEPLQEVKLPGGDGDISRMHLRVTLDGWHVFVTDLGSTNGTLVELPGRNPERLRPNEPFLLQNGTLVTLADGIYFRYEV